MSFWSISRHVRHGEFARIRRDLRVQHHLHQDIAQLFAQVGDIVRLDAIDRFVGFLDHVLGNAGMRLLSIPWAPVGLAQAPDGFDQALKRLARIRQRRGVAHQTCQATASGVLPLRHSVYSSSKTTWLNAPS